MDKIQKPADRAISISLSLPNYKQKCPYQNTKPQVCYRPDGLMVKLSVSQIMPICTCGFESHFNQFNFFPQLFFFSASSFQIHIFNNLGHSMELMKGLEEADKVHVRDK